MAIFDFASNLLSPVTNVRKEYKITPTYEYSTSSVFAPTTTRNIDIQYNIASGQSSIATKKEQAVSTTPTVTPTLTQTATPIVSGDTSQDKNNIFDYLLLGGLVIGGALIIPPLFKKK